MGFTIDVGKAAPGFSLKGVDGKLHSLKDYEDKKAVVVISTMSRKSGGPRKCGNL